MNKLQSTHVLMFVADGIFNPSGGLGVHVRNIVKQIGELRPDYYFTIIGRAYDQKKSGDNYQYIPINEDLVINGNSFFETNTAIHHLYFQYEYLDVVRTINQTDFDLIICNDWPTFVAAKKISTQRRIPLLSIFQLSMYAISSQGMIESFKKNRFNAVFDAQIMNAMYQTEREMIKQSHNVAFVSEAIRKPFLSDDSDYDIIYNGIDTSEFESKRDIELPGDQPFKIVFIGRLNGQKGIFQLLKTDVPEGCDLIIIGGEKGQSVTSGGYTGVELCQMRDKHHPRVHYYGSVWGDEKSDILHAADAVIFPSTHEPFGIVALEALITNNILITTAVTGMQEFLSPDMYIHIDHHNESFREGMKAAINLPDNIRQEFIQRGQKICQQFTWTKAAQNYLNICDKTLHRKEIPNRECNLNMISKTNTIYNKS